MRRWMLPWLVPVAMIAVVVLVAVVPGWLALPLGGVFLFIAVPFVYRLYATVRPDRELPSWLPGSRPPR